MKKICMAMGKLFLGLAALIMIIGPASLAGIALEEIPESMKKKR